jgi:hypothetical protein
MTNTSSRLSALGVLLAVFTAIPAAAEPPGSPGKPDKADKAAEKAEAKAAKAEERAAKADEKADKKATKADEKAAKAEEKADAKAAKAEEKGEDKSEKAGDKEDRPGHGMGLDGAHGRGRGGFRALGRDFAKGSITKAELKERVAAMRNDRNDRRHEHRVDLKARWGATLASPACREELRHHARREAFLGRALFLAQTEVTTKDKDKLVERIQKLIDKEDARHDKAMERLKGMPTPTTAASPPTPAAPAAPAKEGAK